MPTSNPQPVLRNSLINVGGATKAGVEFFVVRPKVSGSGVSGSIVKQGYLGVKNNNLTYPTVGVTDGGRAVISFTLVGADHYPSAAYAGLDLSSGAGPVRVCRGGKGCVGRVHQLQGVRGRPAADPLG